MLGGAEDSCKLFLHDVVHLEQSRRERGDDVRTHADQQFFHFGFEHGIGFRQKHLQQLRRRIFPSKAKAVGREDSTSLAACQQ